MSSAQANLWSETSDVVTASAEYAQRFQGPVGAHFLAVQTALTLELIKPWPQAKVLDVGGGHAQLAGPLARAGHRVTVVGSSEQCRRRLDEVMEPGSFSYQSVDLMDLPFGPRSFDLVLSFRMVTHVNDPPGYIRELCRVADKAVVVDYPAKRSFNLLSGAMFGAKESLDANVHTRHFRSFWDQEIVDLFKEQGFGRPMIRRQHFWPMALHRGLGQGWLTRASEGLSRGLGLTALFGSPVILRVERLS